MKNSSLCFSALLLLVVASLFTGCLSKPVTLEILHINDLHSNFDFGRTPDLGGYAAMKFMLSNLKAQAAAAGHESLTINAGDSFEGHPYYFINRGVESLKLVAALGCEVTIPGNHDFLMGPADFNSLLGQFPPGFNFVGSNYKYDANKYPNVARNLKHYMQIIKGGLRIGIIGLTTNSPFYRWAAGDITITDPVVTAAELIPQLRAQNDILIVVSHLGTADDIRLVKQTAGIDLVVGAHDHVPLAQPLLQPNLVGARVPILQSAPFGEGVGRLVITVNKNRSYAINSYQIVPVPSQRKDAAMDAMVRAEGQKLDDWFGSAWLEEKVGIAQVPLFNDEDGPTAWGQAEAEALRASAHADLGLDFGDFHGMTQLPGPITRRTVLQAYPRMFEFSKTGWNVWTMQVPGALLKTALGYVLNSSFHFELAGATLEVATNNGAKNLNAIRIKGEELDPLRVYTIAIPEAIARGIIEIPKLYTSSLGNALSLLSSDISEDGLAFVNGDLQLINSTLHDTGVPVWNAIIASLQTPAPAAAPQN